jgi:hypothetical protein
VGDYEPQPLFQPRQYRLSAITIESQKMKTAALPVADEFRNDERILRPVWWSMFVVLEQSAEIRQRRRVEICGSHPFTEKL